MLYRLQRKDGEAAEGDVSAPSTGQASGGIGIIRATARTETGRSASATSNYYFATASTSCPTGSTSGPTKSIGVYTLNSRSHSPRAHPGIAKYGRHRLTGAVDNKRSLRYGYVHNRQLGHYGSGYLDLLRGLSPGASSEGAETSKRICLDSPGLAWRK